MALSTIILALLCISHYTQSGDPRSRHAYVFYATQDTYACSILINLFALRHVFYTNYRAIVLLSEDVSIDYHQAFANLGATVLTRAPPPLHPNSAEYYQGCLLKLVAFELFDLQPPLDRIIVMDSDQLILKNLDQAFDLPLAEVSAPKAYWIDNRTYSSTMMTFRPSRRLWDDITTALQQIPSDKDDMDVVNDIFQDNIGELPATYGTLNSHWEDKNTPPWLSIQDPNTEPNLDEVLRELFSRVHIVHFTAVGKPWMYDVARLMEMRPWAHPILVEQWASWRTSALQLCPSGIIDHV